MAWQLHSFHNIKVQIERFGVVKMANGGRVLWREAFKLFKASFRSQKDVEGRLIGQDPFGNKYFEIPADPQ